MGFCCNAIFSFFSGDQSEQNHTFILPCYHHIVHYFLCPNRRGEENLDLTQVGVHLFSEALSIIVSYIVSEYCDHLIGKIIYIDNILRNSYISNTYLKNMVNLQHLFKKF